MPSPSVSTIEQLARLGQVYGPFFFAILFILVVPRTAYGYYVTASTRTNPPTSPADVLVMRTYFAGTVILGAVFACASIGWWFHSQNIRSYTYRVRIVEVVSTVEITGPFHIQKIPRLTAIGGA